MITFPIAKINLGLNVVSKRPDGYHNLQTVFFPVPLHDALEVLPMDERFPSAFDCDMKVSNIHVDGDEQQNLVVKAYRQLRERFDLPRLHAHLYKGIPTQAGMGGGSADCAYMIRLLNDMFCLGMTREEMLAEAARLGADCAFFILDGPAYAEGIGEKVTPLDLSLKDFWIAVVRPDIPVPTREAFSRITPKMPPHNCRDIVRLPVERWRGLLTNDFEDSVFFHHPQIAAIKQRLYDLGAAFALMSGSGSSVFGLFGSEPVGIKECFGNCFVFVGRLS